MTVDSKSTPNAVCHKRFDGKVLLITGGTGSFGHAVLRRVLRTGIQEVRVFSRDEKKQEDQRHYFNNSKIKFMIGDVRELRSVLNAVGGADYIFHAAALKQVPSCEFHPMEAVRTNVLGTENVLEAAISASVASVVCLSTDKAVYPINAMGISKAMMEKVTVARARNADPKRTVISCTRYGNVMASRGSVIPLFVRQVQNGKPITVTDINMTRFVMSLDEAVDLVLFAFDNANSGDMFVQKAPAATVGVLARAVVELMGRPDHPIHIIGTRHGEKRFETLLSREEMVACQDLGGYFRVPADTRDLNYESYFEQGMQEVSVANDYNSDNTRQLDVDGMKAELLKLDYMRKILDGDSAEVYP